MVTGEAKKYDFGPLAAKPGGTLTMELLTIYKDVLSLGNRVQMFPRAKGIFKIF